MNDDPTMESPGASESADMSFLERLSGIYMEPARTFRSIDRRPTWLGIFLIVCVMAIAVTYVLTARVDRETLIRKQMQSSSIARIFTQNLTEEQLQQAVSRPETAFERYGRPVFIVIGALATYAILAGVFLLLVTIMGASLPFKKSLAVTLWSYGPPGIVVSILSVIFMLVKDPQTLAVNPVNNVVSNPGLLVSQAEHPKLASLLSSVDLFSIWTICLLAMGFAACSGGKLTTRKAATGIVMLWLLYVAVKTLLA